MDIALRKTLLKGVGRKNGRKEKKSEAGERIVKSK